MKCKHPSVNKIHLIPILNNVLVKENAGESEYKIRKIYNDI